MDVFEHVAKVWADAERVEEERGDLADYLTLCWLAEAVCKRVDLSPEEAALLIVEIGMDGGPDLRTGKGIACASVILGVPGAPIQPTLH
ncbi:hypothetical protein U1707_08615 [Sphingomonas sp. PB2P12]|uniref:hypothetical protein n=1 Tax=Sphingomonas sandaracina TaxID=3096157 RepID=UPI002FCAC4BC